MQHRAMGRGRAELRPRKYYTLNIDFKIASLTPMRNWVNQNEQMKGYHPDAREPFCGLQFSEPPRIKFDRKGRRGALPDADTSGLSATWLVSDRLKGLLEQIDPEAFVFQRAEVDYGDFSEPGPGYWFCYFMRELDCVDEEHSVIRYFDHVPGIKAYDALLDIKMRPEAVGSAHAFRLKHDHSRSIVDDVIVAAVKVEKIRGFEFKPIQRGQGLAQSQHLALRRPAARSRSRTACDPERTWLHSFRQAVVRLEGVSYKAADGGSSTHRNRAPEGNSQHRS